MKKIYTLLVLMAFSAACFTQEQTPPEKKKTKQDYLYKSYRKKNTGFIMLGVGGLAMLAGGVIVANSIDYGSGWGLPDQASSNSDENAGAILFIAGSASVIGSIPFFIAAHSNKKKANAMTASFKMEKGLPYVQRGMGATYYPALSLNLNIR